MNIEEMSNEFDILYNQVNSNTAPGIDQYEKSVFLTKAQDEIVKAYFDPRGNKFQAGFNINDLGQLRQYDLSTLIEYCVLKRVVSSDSHQYEPYDPRAITFVLPDNLLLTLNESVVEEHSGIPYIYQIISISYSDYARLMQKPYQYPPKRSVWKLISKNGVVDTQGESDRTAHSIGVDDGSTIQLQDSGVISGTLCEIIGRFIDKNAIQYKIRYARKPLPILLDNFAGAGLTIDGHSGGQDDPDAEQDSLNNYIGISCKLPEGVHHLIVQRAVELCTAVYNPQALSSLVGVGNASETNLGIVPSGNNKERD